MSQPPNPPTGGSPQQPGGWSPQPGGGDWQSDPTQQLPTQPPYSPGQQQYPPTQPLPAQEAYGPGQYGSNAPGGYPPPGPYGAPGQYGAAGQHGAPGQQGGPGQYGAPGQYGPPGNNFGAPPPPGGGSGAPPAGGGRGPLPLVIGIVAGVVVLGLVAWFLFLRPAGSATPTPSTDVSNPPQQSASATPSVLISPSAAPPSETPSASPSGRPSGTTSAACGSELNKTQCEWAVYLRAFVQVDTCRLDDRDRQRDAFSCDANARGKLKGTATVSMRWANDNKDLTGLMDNFFSRAGVAKSKLGKNWKNPPAHTNWWYNDSPKDIKGKLGSADARDGSGRVAWTFSKQRFFIEANSTGDDADAMLAWWART